MSELVKYRTVSITVYPWRHGSGREYWRFKKSDGTQVTRSSKEKIKSEATRYAQTIYRGTLDLDTLTPDQIRVLQRIVDVDPSLKIVDEFLVWKSRARPSVKLLDAREAFTLSKKGTAGHYHKRDVERHLSTLSPLDDRVMSAITAADLKALLPPNSAPRTLANIRQMWVTFWRWSARNELVAKDLADIPAIIDLPPVVRGIPKIYQPEELRVLLKNVTKAYLPWLALAAFAGVRTEEVAPIKHSSKPPLDWSDFHWDRSLIIVRPETAKTGRRRVIPILPALEAWLKPLAKKTGRMSPRIPPSAGEGRCMSETTRLGAFVGGWRRNALRHSFITYRAAMVGISQTAMEAGNSESEARRSYVDAQGEDLAKAWFAILP